MIRFTTYFIKSLIVAGCFANSGALLASSTATACQDASLCTIDVLVAYTDNAAKWSEQGQGTSCASLQASGADDLFAKLTVRKESGEAFQAIKHPCRSQSALGTSQDAMDNLIKIGMAELNAIYQNSGLAVHFRLVGTHRLSHADGSPYQEGSWLDGDGIGARGDRHEDDVARLLSDNLPFLGELVKARNVAESPDAFRALAAAKSAKKADIVVVLVGDNYGGPTVRGIASAIGVMDPKNAVAVLQVQGALAPIFAMSHEVSHLMGAGHYEFKSALNLDVVKLLALDAVNSYGHDYARAVMTPDLKYATVMGGADKAENYQILPFLSNTAVEVAFDGDEDNAITLGESGAPGRIGRDNAKAIMQSVALIEQFDGQGEKNSPEKADRIAIDFGYDTFNQHSYQTSTQAEGPYGYWNNLVNHRKNARIGGEENPILTQSGAPTEIELVVSSSFSGKITPPWIVRAFSDFGFDSLPPMAVSDGFYALSNWNSGELTLENLNEKARYTFEFFGSGPSLAVTRKTRFSVSGRNAEGESETFGAILTTEPNIFRSATLSGVRPLADGSLTIKVSGETAWVWHTASLNALRFWQEEI